MSAHLVALLLAFVGPQDDQATVDFATQIKPIFSEKCSSCHGAIAQEMGLRLDAGSLIHKGSEAGPIIVPGEATQSLLVDRVASTDLDLRMPPDGVGEALTAQQVELLSRWIDQGALFPEDERIPPGPKEHWAYQPPQRAAIDLDSHQNPIDAFLQRSQDQAGLKTASNAEATTLLRRVHLDLVGLPPTRTEIDRFLQDNSPVAWEGVVNQLLDSPHYGERWGRHWMDVWRYSDWDGYKNELRGSQRHIWRWRDWIVRSLNDDKGYDRMIVEMLAGDEVYPGDESVLPATGFLARNYHKSNRNIWLDATVEHTAKAFLGVTLNCARCHDHKYDPIAQTAYYQFRAIFEPHQIRTDRRPGQLNVANDGIPRAYDAELEAPTFLYLNGNDKHPDEGHPMIPGVPEVLGGDFNIQSIELPWQAYYPGLREFVVNERVEAARRKLAQAEEALAKARSSESTSNGDEEDAESVALHLLEARRNVGELELNSLEARFAADRTRFVNVDDSIVNTFARDAAILERQLAVAKLEVTLLEKQIAIETAKTSDEPDPEKKQQAITKAESELVEVQKQHEEAVETLASTDSDYTPFDTKYPQTSTGRRRALAMWIASSENPLTARVAVNHIWMRHFGTPLVDNVFDFGMRTSRPLHHDLLDWLAVELMENQWSMKHIHRLILNSNTWQRSSSPSPETVEHNHSIDPDNLHYWRMNVDRLDAEIVRDSLLAVSEQLDETIGGADIDYLQGEETKRRSIYLRHAYEKQMKMLVLFDAASPNECYRRSESIIPQQALALANSSLSISQSRLLAGKLWSECEDEGMDQSQFVRMAFLQILSRQPTDDESKLCVQFLSQQTELLSDPEKLSPFEGGTVPKVAPSEDPAQRARENLVLVLFNHNDFINAR